MSGETSTTLLRRLFERGMNEGDGSVIDELVSPQYVNHDAPIPTRGAEGFKNLVGMFKAAFPDIRVTIEDAYADGDRVGSRGTFTGTHEGEFMGVPPTSKSVIIKYLDLWRVEDGKFVETWVRMDILGLMQQLGALGAPSG
jgi:predicted ester cyclase